MMDAPGSLSCCSSIPSCACTPGKRIRIIVCERFHANYWKRDVYTSPSDIPRGELRTKSGGANTSTSATALSTNFLHSFIIPSRKKLSILESGDAKPPAYKSPNLFSKVTIPKREHKSVSTCRWFELHFGSCKHLQKFDIIACYKEKIKNEFSHGSGIEWLQSMQNEVNFKE